MGFSFKHRKSLFPTVLAALIFLVCMAMYEWIDDLIWPHMSVRQWELHTNLFITIITVISAYFIWRFLGAQSLLGAIVESSDDAIIGLTLDGSIASWNRGAEKIYGYSAREMKGKSIYSVVPPEHTEEVAGILKRIRRGEYIDHFESERMTKGGARIYTSSTFSPIKNAAGRIIGISTVVRDITARKLSEGALQRAHDELERRVEERTAELRSVNDQLRAEIEARKQIEEKLRVSMASLEQKHRELNDFTFIASHDLQEPLRKIQVFSDRLQKRTLEPLGEHDSDALRRINSAANWMQTLVQAVIDYSLLTTREEPFTSVDLKELLHSLVKQDLHGLVEQTGGHVEIGDLPVIEASEGQMCSLFENLVANALKFHGEEKPVVRIYHQACWDGFSKIVVEDNGIGFDQKYADRIFRPLQRLNKKDEYEGSGMGLAVCRKIVERHGGTITATSTPGKGSAFIVSLPSSQSPHQTYDITAKEEEELAPHLLPNVPN